MIMLRKILVFILLVLCGATAWSQDIPTKDTLVGSFAKLHLVKRNYVINDVISITDSLIVDPGATIRLGDNVTVVCMGAVMFNGAPGNAGRIRVTSRKGQTGSGLVIVAQNNYPMFINNTTFDSLVAPIVFQEGWFRPDVTIQNSQFIRNVGTSSVIQVVNPTVFFSDVTPVSNFRVSQNLFAGNTAAVRFEDLQSEYLKIEVVNNSFVGNRISGYGFYSFSSNVLWGRMDKMQNRFKALIKGNSFVYNYFREIDADTLIQASNIGVFGTGDSLAALGNYLGADNEADVRKTLFDYSTNYNSPKLSILPIEYAPSDTVPAHVYDIVNTSGRGSTAKQKMKFLDNKWQMVGDSASYLTYDYNLRKGLRSFKMVSNRPLVTRLMELHFIYLKDSLQLGDTTILAASYKRDETVKNNIILTLSVFTDSMFRTRPGYLVVRGLEGQQGEFVPDVLIGYQSFLKYVYSKRDQNVRGKVMSPNDSSIQKLKEPPVITMKYKKKYEIGLVAGNAIYYGTLSNPSLFSNDFNSIFGIQLRYNHKKNFSISFSYLTTTLTGADKRSGDTAKAARGFAFSTPVTCMSFQFEYDFLDHSYYSSKYRLHPVLGFGIDNIGFKPTGEYLGKTYELQPLGTGGQNIPSTGLPGADSVHTPYALSSLGAPVTFMLRYYLNQKTIFSLFATYHLAFTNYLDDVGPDPYPDQAKVRASVADPTMAEAAAYFSNPTNRFVRKGQLRSGAADVSDGFFTFGFTLMRHF